MNELKILGVDANVYFKNIEYCIKNPRKTHDPFPKHLKTFSTNFSKFEIVSFVIKKQHLPGIRLGKPIKTYRL